ncbi:MAG: 30S ribosomal protein S5 [bacterium]|nr:30S ribosomal protein S5 [bacterium]
METTIQQPKPNTDPTGVPEQKKQFPPGGGDRRGQRRPYGGARRGGRRDFESKDQYKEKMLDLRRVTRVVAGGKRFRFRATIVLGDEKGVVGVGVGKGLDVQSAIGKAKRDAKKNLITIPLKGRTIPHEVRAKFSAAEVLIKPAVPGHGLIAGGAVRVVLSLAGIFDITAKCLGRTPNKLTNAMAAIKALAQLRAEKR